MQNFKANSARKEHSESAPVALCANRLQTDSFPVQARSQSSFVSERFDSLSLRSCCCYFFLVNNNKFALWSYMFDFWEVSLLRNAKNPTFCGVIWHNFGILQLHSQLRLRSLVFPSFVLSIETTESIQLLSGSSRLIFSKKLKVCGQT